MPKVIDIGVEKDHIESLTRSNGISALSELIWNSLDADANDIRINYRKNGLNGYKEITVEDDGHGLKYTKALEVFGRLGGSEKKTKSVSPKGRAFHGKDGKGRYKALALGDLVIFESVFKDNGVFKKFTIKLDRNNLSNSVIDDPEIIKISKSNIDLIKSKFKVSIINVNHKNAEQALTVSNRKDYIEKLASYWVNYPTFNIRFNNAELEFDNLIKHFKEDKFKLPINGKKYEFFVKIVEWNFDNKKKTYLCNAKGIPFKETNLGVRSSLPISIFIQSDYIEELYRQSKLDLSEMDDNVTAVINDAKKTARTYIRNRLHHYSRKFIEELKKEGVYPYKEEPKEVSEKAERQVFDIVALNINEYLPSFNEQDKYGKKLTLSLIKEALGSNSENLQKILTEVIELPDDKRDELVELLDKASLVNIIDTIKEVTDRLAFLNGLEQIIYDKGKNKNVKERKHLHKIIINETWIFGDEYTYGADDITLKNVLKEYLKYLGRNDFEEIIKSEDNSDLGTIPDVCLWQQFPSGKKGHFQNLVIELKRPTKDAGLIELAQIQSYAAKVTKDRRFPKGKTKWKFLLITKNIKDEIEPQLEQQNREYGHVTETDHMDVIVLTWGDIINNAKSRYTYR